MKDSSYGKKILYKLVLVAVMLVMAVGSAWADGKKTQEQIDFENKAYNIRTDLVHNHTYDKENIAIADTLYAESKRVKSEIGKLYALQIKYYALAGNNRAKDFEKTVNEFMDIALENKYYEEYFDAASAKTQFLMGQGEYTKCMFIAKEMLKTAEDVRNVNGVYESNMLLGQIYKFRGAWLIAENYFDKSLAAVAKMEDQDSIPYSLLYREISECNIGANNHSKAIEYAIKAKSWANFDIYRIYCEWTYLAALYNSGNLDYFRKEYAKSIIRKAEYSAMLTPEMLSQIEIMALVSQGNYVEAKKKTLELEGSNKKYGLLTNIYYYEGNYKAAYEYLQKSISQSDSVEMALLQSELTEMDARLGNATLRYEAEEAKSHQRLILGVSAVVVFVFIITTLLINLNRRRRQNKKLQDAYLAIEHKNAQLLEANETTEKALEAAEQANAMRIRFIENMTHEIRTPLNAISGFTQVLTSADMNLQSEEAQEMRDIIMRNTNNLTQMLDNIIAISSYDTSTVDLKIKEVTVQSIIDKAIQDTPHSFSTKEVTFQVDKSEACNAVISTDINLASKALSRLLTNAFKYTKQGSVTVSAEKVGNGASIIVTDTGIGVTDDKAEKIFERFYKVDEFVPGTGLGLSLCRAAVTTLGGTVKLDTNYKEGGCRFVITLP